MSWEVILSCGAEGRGVKEAIRRKAAAVRTGRWMKELFLGRSFWDKTHWYE
jgi:hypothetical protein